MGWFRRAKVPRDDAAALREWVAARGATKGGVEAYVEPKTSVSPTTVVLVAGDGEFMRRGVSSPEAAAKFARSVGIPIYDTNRVGLPKRMREYVLRSQNARQEAGQPPRPPVRSARQWDAVETLASIAAMGAPSSQASDDELQALVRAARAKAHPDRNGGDRTAWDAVEEAARALGLR
ncbi:MAG TPA: hypothetical protein VM093_07585 [Aeromicrobium sp.]|nr:hypothetical protein [Aeromicrobium sp.]